ncbi:MAG: hypothetical protein V2I57_09440 [Xanthomonadales bacterium]|jgi:YHS domain-containing protein|nr:hypothetical protein [Xanthomonadales bacterium]
MTETVRCPVSNQQVPSDKLSLEYNGERFAFCCPHCRARFIEDCELEFIRSTAGVNASGE